MNGDFNSLDWTVDETGLFADNRKTGERILLSRFNKEERSGILLTNTKGTMVWGYTKWGECTWM